MVLVTNKVLVVVLVNNKVVVMVIMVLVTNKVVVMDGEVARQGLGSQEA